MSSTVGWDNKSLINIMELESYIAAPLLLFCYTKSAIIEYQAYYIVICFNFDG